MSTNNNFISAHNFTTNNRTFKKPRHEIKGQLTIVFYCQEIETKTGESSDWLFCFNSSVKRILNISLLWDYQSRCRPAC